MLSVEVPVQVLSDLLISVEDEEGNPLSGVNVSSTSQPLGQEPLSCLLDGEFTFKKILPGRYVFSLEKEKYLTAAKYIQVNETGILYSADTVVMSLIPYDYRPIFLLFTIVGFLSVGYIYWSSNKITKPIPVTTDELDYTAHKDHPTRAEGKDDPVSIFIEQTARVQNDIHSGVIEKPIEMENDPEPEIIEQAEARAYSFNNTR